MWFIGTHWQLHMDTVTSAQAHVPPTTNCVLQQRVAPVSPSFWYPAIFSIPVQYSIVNTPIHNSLENRVQGAVFP